ncbi:MAG: hypothetical protein NDJ94_15010 [Vicinamibacteria bacterium]|nr:hypothetical protein [Vicinamibacteria bacterium]
MGRALVAVFFAAAFLQFAHPLADGDLWWHLATGRFVLEQGHLPDGDPFGYTVSAPFEARARMSVRANWLAQVVYQGLYLAGGFQALRLFNALLFVAVVAVVYQVLRLRGVETAPALLLVSPLSAFCWWYDELRPLGFSVLLTATSLGLIERAQVRGLGARGLLALVPLCALWANLHRGFPVVALVLTPYALAWLRERRWREVGVLAAAAAATLLNPSGLAPWRAAVEESFQGASSFAILELASPWEFARLESGGAGGTFLPLLVTIVLLSAALLIACRRELRVEHALLWLLLAVAGATAFRYTIYFAVGALVASAAAASRALGGAATARLAPAAPAAVVAVAVALAWAAPRPTWRAIDDRAVPVAAVDALLGHDLPGPLLNTFDHGGYLIWRAWPRHRVFLDARLLDYSVYDELGTAERTGLGPLLARRGINTVLYPTLDRRLRVRRAILDLLSRPDWALVHYDALATLFVRRSAAPGVAEVSRVGFADQLLGVIAHRSRGRAPDAGERAEAAAILRATGRDTEAQALLPAR